MGAYPERVLSCAQLRQTDSLCFDFGSRLHGPLLDADPTRGASAVPGEPPGVAGPAAQGEGRLQQGNRRSKLGR